MNLFKKLAAIPVLLLFCFLLASFSFSFSKKSEADPSGIVESSPQQSAEEIASIPSPTSPPVTVLGVSYPWDTESLTLNIGPDEIITVLPSLRAFPNLTHLIIPESSSAFTADDFLTLSEALPATEVDCTFDLFGQLFNTVRTTRLEYLQVPVGDSGLDVFRKLLPYLHHLSYLSFDRCDTTDEACAALRDAFPETEIVWRVYFPPFSCMTDIETIWASVDLRDETCASLKYCTKVKYMDIGHSAMTDLSFLDYMPDLEVLIIACSSFEDISHVANCKNLKYLEACECFYLEDLSPIAELKNLEHLNVGDLNVSDISCLHSLTECKNLKRFYAPNMRNLNLDMEKEAEIFRNLLPGVEMDFDKTYMGLGSLNGHWRHVDGYNGSVFTEPYRRIREIFGYDKGALSQPRLF